MSRAYFCVLFRRTAYFSHSVCTYSPYLTYWRHRREYGIGILGESLKSFHYITVGRADFNSYRTKTGKKILLTIQIKSTSSHYNIPPIPPQIR